MGLEPGRDDFKAAVIMLAILRVGAREAALKTFTNYPITFIRKILTRCRVAGILKKKGLHVEWYHRQYGQDYFIRDVQTAVGLRR